MPLNDALLNIATLGYHSYRQQLKLKQENFELVQENKSLRDQVGTGITGGLSTARVLTGMFKDNQEELFQKPTALQPKAPLSPPLAAPEKPTPEQKQEADEFIVQQVDPDLSVQGEKVASAVNPPDGKSIRKSEKK